jgi:hypothetical protein
MSTLVVIISLVFAFVAGLLVGRRHPNIADAVAAKANEAKDKASEIVPKT